MKRVSVFIITAILLISALAVVSFADDTDVFGVGGEKNTPSNWDEANGIYSAAELTKNEYGKIALTVVIGIIVIAAAAVVVYIVLKKKNKEFVRRDPRRADQGDRSTSVTEMRPVEEYLEIDPDFDEKALEDAAADLFLRLQECRTKRDVTELEPLMASDVYGHYVHECKSMMMQGQTPIIEKPRVDKVTVRGFKRGTYHDHFKIKLEVSMIEYTISDRSRRRRSGDRDKVVKKKYEWDMRRRRSDVEIEKDREEAKDALGVWKLDSIKALLNKES